MFRDPRKKKARDLLRVFFYGHRPSLLKLFLRDCPEWEGSFFWKDPNYKNEYRHWLRKKLGKKFYTDGRWWEIERINAPAKERRLERRKQRRRELRALYRGEDMPKYIKTDHRHWRMSWY